VFLLFLVMVPVLSFAQSVADEYVDTHAGLSADDAVTQALEREPGLQAVRGEIGVARGQRTQAAMRANPNVTFERREEPSGSDNLTMVQVQWPLELFRRSARTQVADRQIETVQQTVGDRARLLAGDVRMRYGDAAAAVRRLQLAERARDSLARQATLVNARVAEGAAPPLERDQLDVEVRRAEVDVLLTSADADAAMLVLKRSMGLTPEAMLRLRESLDTLAMPTTARGTEDDVEQQRPDVRAAEAATRLADARLADARANGRFDLSIYGAYMRMNSTYPQFGLTAAGFTEQVHGVFHYVSAGVTAAIPLTNKNEGTIAAARAEQAISASRLRMVKSDAAEELAIAQSRVEKSQRAIAVSASAVAQSDKNRNVIEQTYQLGRTTLNDVLAEERRYVEAEKSHTMVLKAAYDALIALRSARGEQ
jgi:cobalt-zinc-cadmium efflux system outer membrane protein